MNYIVPKQVWEGLIENKWVDQQAWTVDKQVKLTRDELIALSKKQIDQYWFWWGSGLLADTRNM